jgi:L-ascorbate metabolism protein UlaG (beta-lactamase superfamily)
MKKHFQNIITSVLFLLLTHPGFGQTNEMTVTFIGNAGFHLTDGTTNIYFDFPYKSGAYGYMTYNDSELTRIKDSSIFIFTHKHADHYSKKLVRKLNGKIYDGHNRKKVNRLEKDIPGFKIKSYRTKHRFSFNHYSYVIDWHGKRFFVSGDTEHPETLGLIKEIDYAFIPTWILSYAKEKNTTIDAKTKVLYHLYPDEKVAEKSKAGFIVFDQQGMNIKIPY